MVAVYSGWEFCPTTFRLPRNIHRQRFSPARSLSAESQGLSLGPLVVFAVFALRLSSKPLLPWPPTPCSGLLPSASGDAIAFPYRPFHTPASLASRTPYHVSTWRR